MWIVYRLIPTLAVKKTRKQSTIDMTSLIEPEEDGEDKQVCVCVHVWSSELDPLPRTFNFNDTLSVSYALISPVYGNGRQIYKSMHGESVCLYR